MVIAVTMVDNPSDTGIDDQVPASPKTGGSISKQGTKNKNCRVRLKKMDILAFPMD